MSKAPGVSRIPGGGRIPVLKQTKGAIRRTIQNGLSSGCGLSKNKLPTIKNISRSMDANQDEKVPADVTFDKIPAIVTKDATFNMNDKTDPEKTFSMPDLAKDQTFDINDKTNQEKSFLLPDLAKDQTFDINKTIDCQPEMVKSIGIDNKTNQVNDKILELRKKVEAIKSKSNNDNWKSIEPVEEDHGGSGPYSLLVGLNQTATMEGCVNLIEAPANDFAKTNERFLATDEPMIENESMPCMNATIESNLIENESMPSPLDVALESNNFQQDDKFILYENFIEHESMPSLLGATLESNQFGSRLSLYSNFVNNVEIESNTTMSMLNAENMGSGMKLLDSVDNMHLENVIYTPPTYNEFELHRLSAVVEKLPDVTINPVTNFQTQITSSPFLVAEDKPFLQNKKKSRPSEYGSKQFVLQPLTRKQNDASQKIASADNPDVLSKFRDNQKSANTVSPTCLENPVYEVSKQNSLDESLGILTPEQMDSLSFLENVLSPSTDNLDGSENCDKITEKTQSISPQTPTEIIVSLSPDVVRKASKSNSPLCEEADLTFMPIDQTKYIDQNTIDLKPDHKPFDSDKNLEKITNDINMHDDSYEMFLQRPFKKSTEENLANGNELCLSVGTNHPIDDELLPSVHSSILDALSSIVDTTRFDNIQHGVRMDQTPSPEELPLDTVDIIKSDISGISADPKTDNSKSVTYSITSITSLDGYQGDGEMSRPVSRGADQSPTIGHRAVNDQNWQNIPINRRPDPMTDSDFFTESDADGHDELMHRGDRRAQVIDGALYGGGKNSNPPVLVSRNGNSNYDSCMESSGVFTDVETHRCSPLLLNAIDDLSPEASSPSTRSDLSQNNRSEMYHPAFNDSFNNTVVAVNANSSSDSKESREINKSLDQSKDKDVSREGFLSPSGSNDKMNKEDKNMALKRYKMPRREVASKVKTMINSSGKSADNMDKPKKEGRWDAVMNKILVNKTESKPKSYLKDVKSKVNSSTSSDKASYEDGPTPVSKTKAKTSAVKLKSRRVKTSRTPKMSMLGNSNRSTPHSSQSDISCSAPSKIATAKHPTTRAAKKRDGGPGPGRTLSPQSNAPANTPSHTPSLPGQGALPAPQYSPRNRTPPVANQRPTALVKKSGVANGLNGASPPTVPTVNNALSKNSITPRKPISRRAASQLSPRVPLKDQNRASSPANVLKAPAKAGATPSLGPVSASTQSPQTRDVEALAVLVQYLVFQLDALNAPRWKAQAAEAKTQLSEAAGRLQRVLVAQQTDRTALTQNLNRITQLENQLKLQESEANTKVLDITVTAENKYRAALEESSILAAEIRNLKATLGELKRDVAESRARVVEAENAGKNHLNDLKVAKDEIERLRIANSEIEKALTSQIQENEIMRLAHQKESKENTPIKSNYNEANGSATNKGKETTKSRESKMAAEIESLKSVLEMKMEELSIYRKKSEEHQHAADQLASSVQKVITLTANVEDLRTQLDIKSQEENNLKQQCKLLEESFVRESTAKNRLSQHNEELRYKLKHSSEVFNYLAGMRNEQNTAPTQVRRSDAVLGNQTYPEDNFIRHQARTSFNEKFLSLANAPDRQDWQSNLRRSTRSESSDEKTRYAEYFQGSESSPPNSPKIKGVVEKNDSVSYVLEIEETPEEMAARLVKRAGSFRLSTSSPPREAVKRQRSRGKANLTASPLSQSASASCLEPVLLRTGSTHCKLFRSNSIEPESNLRMRTNRPLRTSTPRKNGLHLRAINSDSMPNGGIKNQMEEPYSDGKLSLRRLESNYESNAAITNEDLMLLKECESVPKESAGEALISGANSEDDSSIDDPSHSSSDSESVCDKYLDINGAGERLADPVLQKIAETMNQSLSATPMDVSWSEDGVTGASESDI